LRQHEPDEPDLGLSKMATDDEHDDDDDDDGDDDDDDDDGDDDDDEIAYIYCVFCNIGS